MIWACVMCNRCPPLSSHPMEPGKSCATARANTCFTSVSPCPAIQLTDMPGCLGYVWAHYPCHSQAILRFLLDLASNGLLVSNA